MQVVGICCPHGKIDRPLVSLLVNAFQIFVWHDLIVCAEEQDLQFVGLQQFRLIWIIMTICWCCLFASITWWLAGMPTRKTRVQACRTGSLSSLVEGNGFMKASEVAHAPEHGMCHSGVCSS
jgi:hypothetical protein